MQNSLPCIRNQPGNHWIFPNRLSGNGKKKRKRQRKSPHGKTGFRGRITTVRSSSPQEGKEGGLILKELHPVSGRQFRIDKTHPTIIGQLKDQADLVLPSTAVSRVHASIEQRAGSWYLKDLNSRNGTWVNDQELYGEEEKELTTGDQIQFADLVYRVEI